MSSLEMIWMMTGMRVIWRNRLQRERNPTTERSSYPPILWRTLKMDILFTSKSPRRTPVPMIRERDHLVEQVSRLILIHQTITQLLDMIGILSISQTFQQDYP